MKISTVSIVLKLKIISALFRSGTLRTWPLHFKNEDLTHYIQRYKELLIAPWDRVVYNVERLGVNIKI